MLVPEGPSKILVDSTRRFMRIELDSDADRSPTSIHYATVMNTGDTPLSLDLHYTQQVALPEALAAPPRAFKAARLSVEPRRGFGLELLMAVEGEGIEGIALEAGT